MQDEPIAHLNLSGLDLPELCRTTAQAIATRDQQAPHRAVQILSEVRNRASTAASAGSSRLEVMPLTGDDFDRRRNPNIHDDLPFGCWSWRLIGAARLVWDALSRKGLKPDIEYTPNDLLHPFKIAIRW